MVILSSLVLQNLDNREFHRETEASLDGLSIKYLKGGVRVAPGLAQRAVSAGCQRSGGIFLILGWLALGFGASQTPSSSQPNESSLKKLSLEQLSQIEITSVSKEANRGFKTPAAISVLTSEDIRRSGATNIPDLLRLIPGIDVAQIDGDKWAIGIRGFQGKLSKSVLVLIDGRSVYTPLFAGVYWEMQDTLIEDIERIEVIRGPGGTIWGSNAVNGVINIITKSAMDTHGALVAAGGGNVEQGFLHARYGGGDDRLSYRVYGKGFTRAPGFHSDGRNFDDWRSGRGGFRMDAAIGQRDSFTLQGDAYATIAGQELAISNYSPPALPIVRVNGNFYGENIMGQWRRTFNSGADIQVRAYYDRTDRQDINYREIRHTVDVDFIHHIPLERHDIVWGLGARVSPSRFFQTAPGVDFLPHEQTYSLYSGFVQDEISLVPDRLYLTLGTKLEHNTFSGFEVQPSARLAWTPTEQSTFWGAVTRAVRTPSRIEDGFRFTFLQIANIPQFLRLVGDGQFSSEQLIGYEAGYRNYIRRNGFVSLAAFYNRYDDLLSVELGASFAETLPSPTHVILPLYFRNGVRAETAGMEVSTLFDLTDWWRLRDSYSFLALNAADKPASIDASTVRQLQGDSPQHKIVVQSSFSLPRNVDVDLTYRFVSSVPDQNVPAYSTGDARIGWRFARQFDLSLAGRNLLQPSHVEYGGDPGLLVGVRRSFYVTLQWNR